MSYINVGASDRLTGLRIKSKKALKEALSQDLASVVFDGTSPMGPQDFAHPATVSALTDGHKLSVVGPDPYTKRSWYASVFLVDGKIRVL